MDTKNDEFLQQSLSSGTPLFSEDSACRVYVFWHNCNPFKIWASKKQKKRETKNVEKVSNQLGVVD